MGTVIVCIFVLAGLHFIDIWEWISKCVDSTHDVGVVRACIHTGLTNNAFKC